MKKRNKIIHPLTDYENRDLKKWCLEQANIWKWDAGSNYSHGAAVGGMGISRSASEPDIIARAQKIYDWVTK